MFHRIYTQEQLSGYFMSANIMNVLCLFGNMIFHRYIPTYTTIGIIIDNFDNFSLFVTCLIVVSQALIMFTNNHQYLMKYKIFFITIELAIATFFVWVLTFNSVMQDATVEFYSTASIAPHHKLRIVVLLGFIAIMLCFDLYYSSKKSMNGIDSQSIRDDITSGIRLFIAKYLVFVVMLTGIFHIDQFQELSALGLSYLKSMFIIDFNLFICIMLIVLTYFLYNRYNEQKI